MRRAPLLLVLLVVAAPALAGPAIDPGRSATGPGATPASLPLHWRPRPWQPPSALAGATARVAVHLSSNTPIGMTDGDVTALQIARRAALAGVRVQTRPDGSRFAIVGGLMRSFAIVTVGPDGRLSGDCVQSEAEALRRIGTAAAPAPAPERR
jgi:hypothetical protein